MNHSPCSYDAVPSVSDKLGHTAQNLPPRQALGFLVTVNDLQLNCPENRFAGHREVEEWKKSDTESSHREGKGIHEKNPGSTRENT